MKINRALFAGLLAASFLLGACSDDRSREQFRQDLQSRLDRFEVKIKELKARAGEVKEELRPRFEALVTDLEAKRTRAAEKLHAVGNASGASWERFKSDAKSAMDDLGETVERGWNELVR